MNSQLLYLRRISRLLACAAAFLLAVSNVWAVEGTFPLGPNGDVAHWLYTGRHVRVLAAGENKNLRKIALGQPSHFSLQDLSANELGSLADGTRPKIRILGDGACIADYQFYRQLSFVEACLVTDLHAPKAGEVSGLVWLDRGGVELYLNGKSVLTHFVTQSSVQGVPVKLSLVPGLNRIVIRRTCLGERNVPFQTGLRVTDPGVAVTVRLPVANEVLAQHLTQHQWLQGLRSDRDGTLTATQSPEFPVRIIFAGHILPWRPTLQTRSAVWPAGSTTLRLSDLGDEVLGLWVEVGEKESGIRKAFDWPWLAPLRSGTASDLAEHRKELLASRQDINWTLFAGLKVLRLLDDGVPATDPQVEAEVDRAVAAIANRDGTTDFQTNAAIRLLFADGNRLTARQREVLRRELLDSTYWSDEGEIGTMTFSSENHQVMLHASSRLVAALYPDGTFLRSGRAAADQAEVARKRLKDWFTVRERSGIHEFLAPAYNNETFLALVNLYDYDQDPDIRARAGRMMDHILSFSALHSFRGFTLGPNGRSYRQELLAPQLEGRSAIQSWYSPTAIFSPNTISTALAHSTYKGLPMDPLLQKDIERSDTMGGTVVYLRRTKDYLLGTSTNPSAVVQEEANPFKFLAPGQSMYQHHLWEISLGGHARIFTQSPASHDEILDARPGYWVGEQSAPTIAASEGRVLAIYRLNPDSLVPFTHAWWPSAAFDEETVDGHWAFARKNEGYAALWCSVPLVKYSNVAQGCELRANSRESAWMGIASSQSEAGSFSEFKRKCLALTPVYAPTQGLLTVAGKPRLVYGEGLRGPVTHSSR